MPNSERASAGEILDCIAITRDFVGRLVDVFPSLPPGSHDIVRQAADASLLEVVAGAERQAGAVLARLPTVQTDDAGGVTCTGCPAPPKVGMTYCEEHTVCDPRRLISDNEIMAEWKAIVDTGRNPSHAEIIKILNNGNRDRSTAVRAWYKRNQNKRYNGARPRVRVTTK